MFNNVVFYFLRSLEEEERHLRTLLNQIDSVSSVCEISKKIIFLNLFPNLLTSLGIRFQYF